MWPKQTTANAPSASTSARGVTFREVAHEYLRWLEDVKGAKPATLRNHAERARRPRRPVQAREGHDHRPRDDRPRQPTSSEDQHA